MSNVRRSAATYPPFVRFSCSRPVSNEPRESPSQFGLCGYERSRLHEPSADALPSSIPKVRTPASMFGVIWILPTRLAPPMHDVRDTECVVALLATDRTHFFRKRKHRQRRMRAV